MIRRRHPAPWLSGILGLTLLWATGVSRAVETAATPAEETVIPVLCYHRFGGYPDRDPYFVTVAEFTRQLAVIEAEGFTPITASAAADALDGRGTLPPKPLLITVDDGYADFITNALPVLQAKGYPATVFLYTQFIGSRLGLKRAQLKDLAAAGVEIGSHSATHPHLNRRLAEESDAAYAARLRQELAGSRDALRSWTGQPVESLAYPYGLWNAETAQAARAAGYRLMFTVDPGVNARWTDPTQWKRLMVLHGTSEKTFRQWLRDRPLRLAERRPEPGSASIEPIRSVRAVIVEAQRGRLDPGSLRMYKGSMSLAAQYDPAGGAVNAVLPAPWQRGTDLILIEAWDRARQNRYRESWQARVEAANQGTPAQGGK